MQSKKSTDRERKELKAELEREKKQREHESDGDWHCGDPHCRYINFQKNSVCKMCEKPPPETPVFWDVTDTAKPSKKVKSKKSKKESKSKRDSSQDSQDSKRVEETPSLQVPGSKNQVTSFLDDIGDSFDDEISKHLRKCSSSPVKFTNEEEEDVEKENCDVEQEEFKSPTPMMNESIKLEDISSQDLSLSQEDLIEAEKKEALDPKFSWKDRSNTSGEFELTLEINEPEFLDTVKNEYRSSSPSWSNTKFKFPIKEAKSYICKTESLPTLPKEDSNPERSVSVRKRMEDQIKKETETDSQTVKDEEAKLSERKPTKREELEPGKIKSRTNYRSSLADSSAKASHELSPRDRRKVDEERTSEKRKKDDRQQERDRRDRDRNERKREEGRGKSEEGRG